MRPPAGATGRSIRLRLVVAGLVAAVAIEAGIIALQFRGAGTNGAAAISDRASIIRSVAPADIVLAPATTGTASPGTAATSDAASELRVDSVPPGATVFVDGVRKGSTPVVVGSLMRGRHTVRLVRDNVTLEQTVTLEGASTTLLVPLTSPGVTVGWLQIEGPVDFTVSERGQSIGSSAQGRLQVAAGDHRFELANEQIGVRLEQSVRVRANDVSIVRPVLPQGLLHINALPWADVFVDGRAMGTTPKANISLPVGPHRIVFRHPELGELQRDVLVTSREAARVSVDFTQ